jgi:uncharacterized membrane protein
VVRGDKSSISPERIVSVQTAKPSSRLSSIDALRGIVMIFMALDHVRDFFHFGAMSFSPTDLTKTTPILFFTRWITHFCMPLFMFTAGMGAFLFLQHNHTRAQLSRFLWTRGLWFILLEVTVMQLAYNFNFSSRYILLLLVLWIFGICFVVMAGLIYLPIRWLTILSVVVIVFHNCLDGIDAKRFGTAAPIWNVLHQPGVFKIGGRLVLISYPLIPWVAVIAAGFCLAQIFQHEPVVRQKIMLRFGIALTLAFVILRAINHYGDPAPWSHQKSAVFTLLSFLNCTKYPASLAFLLMTLGPGLLVLAYLDRRKFNLSNPLIVFGRVPMFYFVLHFYLIHILVVIAAFLRYGASASHFIFNPVPSMTGPRELFPANFGYSLWVAYGVWVLTVVLLYPICRWFAGVKGRRRDWWLSYL